MRQLYMVSEHDGQNRQWEIRDQFFLDEACPLPLTSISEEEAEIWSCPSMYGLSCLRTVDQTDRPQLLVNRDYLEFDSIATDQMETMREALTWLMIEDGREVAVVS